MPSRVLIVDDYPPIRFAIRTFLECKTAVEVCEAANGLDAIEKAKQLNPDLIVLDLVMPQMNGAEAASVLKRRMPHVPIILFTLYDEAIGESLASALGVDLVLPKAKGLTGLAERAQALLARRNDKAFGAPA